MLKCLEVVVIVKMKGEIWDKNYGHRGILFLLIFDLVPQGHQRQYLRFCSNNIYNSIRLFNKTILRTLSNYSLEYFSTNSTNINKKIVELDF